MLSLTLHQKLNWQQEKYVNWNPPNIFKHRCLEGHRQGEKTARRTGGSICTSSV